MTNIDIILLLLMLGFVVWGIFKGFLWSLIRLASYIGAFLVISASGPGMRDFVVNVLKVSPLIGLVLAYIILFLFMMILGQLIYYILSRVSESLQLGCLNRAAGGIFWGATYLLILAFIVILFDVSPLSLNGRGVKTQVNPFDLDLISEQIDEVLQEKTDEISSTNRDLLQESVEKAQEKFSNAKSFEEQKRVVQELYQSMASNLEETKYDEILNKVDLLSKESLKLKGKKITIDSLVLEIVIEPLADYLENKLLKLK